MASTDIDTAAPGKADPFEYARKIFVNLLLGGTLIMAVIGYTDYRQGLSTKLDQLMLPILACLAPMSAWVITRSPHLMKPVLAFNALMLTIYYEGIFFQAVASHDAVSGYSLASIAQFLPGLYIALFVFLNRRAGLVCWLLYATLALQCLYGLLVANGPVDHGMKEQLYIAILTSHPCCILVLTFMNHLRRMIEDVRNESLTAKERFLAVVSHEVRSPLQTIVASLDLVDKATPAPVLERAIARVKGAAGVLEAQIRDLTAFTKLELSNELRIDTVDLVDLIGLSQQSHGEAAARKGLALHRDVPPQPLMLKADGARLRQIIDNLLSNAIKYTTSGHISAGCQVLPDGMCHLWVEDTGRGIPADKLHKVFEPFVRIKASPQEKIEGSGLGLAVVRQLVGLMDGRLRVTSQIDQGTRVDIHLPLPGARPCSDANAVPPPHTVLVIDDDDSILQSICDLLRQWGVQEIVTATDGAQGQQALCERRFDAALVDLQLPLVSGYDIALAARASTLNATIPLIAMSAMTLDTSEAGAKAFNGYMRKPLSRATLVKTLGQALQQG